MPPGVVTATWTAPGAPAGAVTYSRVAEETTTEVPAVVPKVTAVVPVRLVPLMATGVPPTAGPDIGVMEVTVGAAWPMVKLWAEPSAPE